ncbi:DUF1016 N-terminal domain-containing protein (plasmid) [Rhodococcus aetherivorans]|uniref:DUF1016 N-terminal domain-containing protein n=1 Tax=Rhodococcus aetherivorans TaxID=191292 RepID=UPI0002D249BC|nr:DUF1016 N-terminal domain-containing protein [Rhodococcus aetherivorans]CCW15078.1 protein of unknown function DUF1016 [Rhodococcus aetherivorans]
MNTELLRLYWQIGTTIIERQKAAPWGRKVLAQLSADLRAEFPGAKGFSPANLKYMRRSAEAWPDPDAICQRPVGPLPWCHVIELLEKLDDAELRDWYSAKDIAHGWSRTVLAHQITTVCTSGRVRPLPTSHPRGYAEGLGGAPPVAGVDEAHSKWPQCSPSVLRSSHSERRSPTTYAAPTCRNGKQAGGDRLFHLFALVPIAHLVRRS